ncbi:hypothetical protein ACIRPX_04895 [Streptomyces sp. NPDC101225]|uniref:hypothetical protein n=1 Tax=Streptomyces sp. NPDC101225 TaxID=3366135 RepID=UPI0037FE5771
MAGTSDLLTTARQEHLKYYAALSRHLPALEGEVIAAAHEAIRGLTAPAPDTDIPSSVYPPVLEALAAAVEYCEFSGHPEGVRYYRYWHTLLAADQALCD